MALKEGPTCLGPPLINRIAGLQVMEGMVEGKGLG